MRPIALSGPTYAKMKAPTQTITVSVTASGSSTTNPAKNVRKRLIIGYLNATDR